MKVNFEEVMEDITKWGTKIPTDKYQKQGDYPIIDQGQQFITGYLNENRGLLEDVPVIIFGDHTRVLKYVDFPFFLGADGVKVLKVKNTNFLSKYVYYNLCATTIPNTGYNRHFKWLKQVELKSYSLEEQQQVIDNLDKITNLIEKRKQQLEKLDLLVKSKFIEMFGDLKCNSKIWTCYTFSHFAKIDGQMTTDYKKYANFPHIGIDSIEKGTGELKGYRTVAEDGVISGKYLFSDKHIIYSKIRPNLNKVALPNFEGLCSADAYPILPKAEICNRVYLAYVMRSAFFLEYILHFSKRTNMPKVNKEALFRFNMPLPPIELQNEFAAFVEKTDKAKSKIKQSLEKFDILKKTLMQKYFG